MKRLIFITALITSIIFSSCSTYIDDLKNLTETIHTTYSVNHYFENIENNDFTLDSAKTTTVPAEAESETEAIALVVPGFTAQEVIQQKVKEDGTTVVNIYYKRNIVNISFDPDGGYWNYKEWVEDSSIEPDSEIKTDETWQGKYGAAIPAEIQPDTTLLGKTDYKFAGWIFEEKNLKELTAQTFPAEDTVVKAWWMDLESAVYTVHCYFENTYDDEYTYDENKNSAGSGKVGQYSAFVPVEYSGFTAQPVTQEKIKDDDSTIVNVYYKRNIITVTFSTAGGYWNYSEYAQDKENVTADSEDRTSEGKFGAAITTPDTSNLGKKLLKFNKWLLQDSTSSYLTAESTYPAESVTYNAEYTDADPVDYTVEFYFENIDDDEFTINSSKTKTESGIPETITNVSADSETGFFVQTINQEEIKFDGSTVVKVYYKRKLVKVNFDPNGGIWNYTEWSADKDNVTPENKPITVTGKYGALIQAPATTDLGRNYFTLNDTNTWKLSADVYYTEEDVFSEDITYKAQWTVTPGHTPYNVQCYFDDINGVAQYDSSEDYEEAGTGGEISQLIPKAFPGFEAKPVTQKIISTDMENPTVIEVYYSRKTIKVSFYPNGGYWNYPQYAADKENVTPDSTVAIVSGLYETEYTAPDVTNLGKKSKKFTGWLLNNEGDSYYDADESVYPSEDIVYYAQWEDADPVNYTIEYYFENIEDSEYTLDSEKTEILQMIPEKTTEVTADAVTGFILQPVVNKEVARDGSTVVKVIYNRKTSRITFNIGGSAYWDFYSDNKRTINASASDYSSKYVEGKYGAVVVVPDTTYLGKNNYWFDGWNTAGGTVVSNFTEDATIEYNAHWAKVSTAEPSFPGDISAVLAGNTITVTLPFADQNGWTYQVGIDKTPTTYYSAAYNVDKTQYVITLDASKIAKGVHTIVVAATYNGTTFTKTLTLTKTE